MSDKPKKNDAILITTNHIKGYEEKIVFLSLLLKEFKSLF